MDGEAAPMRRPTRPSPPLAAAGATAQEGAHVVPRLCGPPQLPFAARHSLTFEHCSLHAVWLILVSSAAACAAC